MELHVKRFDELSAAELYAILKLRMEVFMLEQRCLYPELDGLDRDALHVWLSDADSVAAYLRILDRGVLGDHVTIGRVIAVRRRRGLGTAVMREGIRAARERFGGGPVYVEAQTYAQPFYESVGFVRVSDVYIYDGQPHIKMELTL